MGSGDGTEALKATVDGSGLPEPSTVTAGLPENSVKPKYSWTAPVTSTWSPTLTVGAVPV